MNEKWTSEDIIRFLNIYEKYDVLWNTQSSQYRDKSCRELALMGMVQELNMENVTVDIIRSKIKMIKTVYNQERNKILKSKRISPNGQSLYKPKLAWFEKADRFLRNVTSTRTPNNFKMENNEEDFEEVDVQENSIYLCEEQKIPQKTINKMPIKKQLLKKVSSKIIRNDIRKRNNLDVVNAINKLKHIADSKVKEEDEFDHFAKFIAAQLRQLPVVNALHCQEQILSVITQERLTALQQADIEASSSQNHWTLNVT